MKWLWNALFKWASNRQPDLVIGGKERPYLKRHRLLPSNPLLNIFVHEFLRSDDDRALHDHPWLFNISVLLSGEYREHTPHGVFARYCGDIVFRWWKSPHRVELLTIADFVSSQPYNDTPISCWTLFIRGPRIREWGFYCPQGWVHWRDFGGRDDRGAVGKGCDQ
ncbi:hypothetical protein ACO2Q9_02685 [Variovorax sp. VNK109]|uniref:hypothetical protein n=1 Tax=Variovorax sp. VNK109 TaxID=3400919 RepID=UPI003C0D18A4